MPDPIPALRGTFGQTEFFLTTLRVGELLEKVRFPTDLPDPEWKDLTIEEKWQRDIDDTRITKYIAPYFAGDPDRFTGALVLAVKNHEEMVFQSWDDVYSIKPALRPIYDYMHVNIGFLRRSGKEVFLPLDGQHRVKAFKYAIDGVNSKNRPILDAQANTDLGRDEVPVILVRFIPLPARRIFNKLNRYAKPTSKSDNLITDDDDAVAVMTREMIGASGIMDPRLVRIGANTLPANAVEFTTLSTVYEINKAIISGLKLYGPKKPEGMDAKQRAVVTPPVCDVWEQWLHEIDLWREALKDPTPSGDQMRQQIRRETILGKPVGQLAMARAFWEIKERIPGISRKDVCSRINLINWDVTDPMWIGVVMHQSGRVIAGRRSNAARDFIAHLAGVQLPDDRKRAVLVSIHGEDDWRNHSLPDPVA